MSNIEYVDLATRLCSLMGETYQALERDQREWWLELAEKTSEVMQEEFDVWLEEIGDVLYG